MWLARDKDTTLKLYRECPICCDWHFEPVDTDWDDAGCIEISCDLYPEVTWENSPVEVELNLTKKQ